MEEDFLLFPFSVQDCVVLLRRPKRAETGKGTMGYRVEERNGKKVLVVSQEEAARVRSIIGNLETLASGLESQSQVQKWLLEIRLVVLRIFVLEP